MGFEANKFTAVTRALNPCLYGLLEHMDIIEAGLLLGTLLCEPERTY